MPGYKAHLAGGLAVSVPMLYLLRHQAGSPGVAALWIGFALAGSLFPDIDTTSKGQKWFFRFWLVILLLLLFFKKYALFIASALLATAPLIVNHRGLFHKSWFLILIPCFTATVFAWNMPEQSKNIFFITLFFVAGTLSHLFLDFGPKRMFR